MVSSEFAAMMDWHALPLALQPHLTAGVPPQCDLQYMKQCQTFAKQAELCAWWETEMSEPELKLAEQWDPNWDRHGAVAPPPPRTAAQRQQLARLRAAGAATTAGAAASAAHMAASPAPPAAPAAGAQPARDPAAAAPAGDAGAAAEREARARAQSKWRTRREYLRERVQLQQERIKASRSLWWTVHYPFWLSMDNDKKHPWFRWLMLQERASAEEVAHWVRHCKQWQSELGKSEALQHMQRMLQLLLVARAGQLTAADVQLIQQSGAQVWRQINEQRAQQIREQYQCEPWQLAWWVLAAQPEYAYLRILHPDQFMPLAPCCPDLHNVIEHMIGTLKRTARKLVLLFLFTPGADHLLRKAWVYQRALLICLKVRARGDMGKRHVAGSIAKWPATVSMVAYDPDEVVAHLHVDDKAHECQFCRQHSSKLPLCKRHESRVSVKFYWGTAGKLIEDTAMT